MGRVKKIADTFNEDYGTNVEHYEEQYNLCKKNNTKFTGNNLKFLFFSIILLKKKNIPLTKEW